MPFPFEVTIIHLREIVKILLGKSELSSSNTFLGKYEIML